MFRRLSAAISSAAPGQQKKVNTNQKQLAVGPEPFHEQNYFSKWSKSEPGQVLLEEAPSDIAAILASCGSPGAVVVICRSGDILGLANDDWTKVVWRNKIAFANEDDAIYHAAYDAGNDWIYLKLAGECTICGISRSSGATSANNDEKGISYSVIVSERQSDWRNFDGISVDAQRRLLFACCYEDEREDITIWQLNDDQNDKTAPPGTALLASVNFSSPAGTNPRFAKEIKPYFCATFTIKNPKQQKHSAAAVVGDLGANVYDRLAGKLPKLLTTTKKLQDCKSVFSTEPDDIFVVAISDFWNHSLEMLIARSKVIDEAINAKTGSDIGDLFSHACTIACRNEEDTTKLGAIYAPYEMVFDPAGNLFIADGSNKRIQIFSFGPTLSPTSSVMTAVWASAPNDSGVRRIAVTVNPKTKDPVALALNGWRTIVCYEKGEGAI